ncbi:MAG: LamG domain-containing protein [Deltaproteobacteria bacterium]|nr:LamG domain-containing protein [Deltaproteobacteria bacterium]
MVRLLAPVRIRGTFGKALQFDGVDDYVEVPHNPSLTWSTENFTVELWLYFVGRSANFASIIAKHTWGSSGWAISSETDGDGFAFINGATQEKYYTTTTTDNLKNRWIHLAFVRRGSEWTWYINGAVDNSGTLTDFVEGTESMQIMGEPAKPRYCEGTIDEVRIYNRALSAEEIIQLFRGGHVWKGLVLWLRFDEGSGTTAGDSSGCGNHGTIYGATWTNGAMILRKPVR